MAEKTSTRRTFVEIAALGAAGLALGSRTAAAQRRDEVDRTKGVELAIATIAMDGFGDEYFQHAFRIAPLVGIRERRVQRLVSAHRHAARDGAHPGGLLPPRPQADLPPGHRVRRQRPQGRHAQALAHGADQATRRPACEVHRHAPRPGGGLEHVIATTAAKGIHKVVNYGTGVTDVHGILKKALGYDYTGYLLIEQAPPLNQDTLVADLIRARDTFRQYERGAAGSRAGK
jgi:hypothetical protein